jgi:hypothetical protein
VNFLNSEFQMAHDKRQIDNFSRFTAIVAARSPIVTIS